MVIQDRLEYAQLEAAITQSESAIIQFKNKDYLPKLRRLHVWNLANMGDALYKSGHHSDALSFYIQAIKVDCDEPSVLNQIGVCLILLGKIDRALYYFELLNRRASTQPDRALALFNSAICHRNSGNLNEAIVALRKSIRCFPEDETIAKLNEFKELNSRQAFQTFKHNIFSKNVLSAPRPDPVIDPNNRSKEFGG